MVTESPGLKANGFSKTAKPDPMTLFSS